MRTSPLDSIHRALGARMTPFGGWEMPLNYPSGTLAEHHACRHGAAAFDVSHLGTVRVEGPGATELLQVTLTNDLRKVEPGRAQYTHLLDPADGSVTDDIIVWWLAPEVFDVMPNASNTDGVTGALSEARAALGAAGIVDAAAVSITDATESRAIVALQGPEARARLATVLPEAAAVGRFRVGAFEFAGVECRVAGTGYTGEDGVECAVPATVADRFWNEVVAQAGFTPAGLGARDTLRLEAGLPLHGHELGPGITSLNAGLGWVVGWDKPSFRGRDALEAQRAAGVTPVLRHLHVEGRRPPRAECPVLDADGAIVGRVTSGNFSPELGHGIALALLDASVPVGAGVTVDLRGTPLAGTLVDRFR